MKRPWVALVLFGAALCLFLGLAAWAKMPRGTKRSYGTIGLAPVPATGQTQCWDELGDPIIDCDGTGQDGELQMGVTYAGPQRFSNNGDGTVTDNLTGLVWLKDANCIGTHDETYHFDNDDSVGDGAVTWQHALDFVAGINDGTYPLCGAGYTDWRLPNVRELQSLIDYGVVNGPTLPADHPFTEVQWSSYGSEILKYYWSSTDFALDHEGAWVAEFGCGIVFPWGKIFPPYCYVWPVRGGK